MKRRSTLESLARQHEHKVDGRSSDVRKLTLKLRFNCENVKYVVEKV